MGFVEAFYSFTVELTIPERDIYAHVRFKLPRHPNESLYFLYARVIAYLHSYRPGLEFGQGLFEPKEPTFWHKDITDEVLVWGEVGCPPEQKIERATRRRPPPEIRVYFYTVEQSVDFCRYLRGSTTNWVEPIEFFLIDPMLLEALIPLERSSARWSAHFSDSTLFLAVADQDLTGEISPIDIWHTYQRVLTNAPQ